MTEIQIWNAVVRQFGQVIALPAGKAVLAEAAPPDGQGACFDVRFGAGAAMSLVLLDFPFDRLTGVDLSLAEVLALPEVLSEGLLTAAVDALKVAVPPSLAALLSLAPAKAAQDCETWLSVQADIGNGATARGLIGGSRKDFVQLATRLQMTGAGSGSAISQALLEGLSLPVAIALGRADLPLSAVQALTPGDVVLADIRPDRRSFQIGDRELVIGRDTVDDSQPATAPGWTVKEIRMTGDTPEPQAVALSLDDVPLSLRFVTEDRRIALGDLQGLGPGSLLPFDVAAVQPGLPVRIQVNNVTIGEGHLVRIDDSYAVRISRISPRSS